MEQSSMFYGSNEMDTTQQIRFSSSSEINTTGGPYTESLPINKRRACSNGFPNQLLLDTSTQYAWAPVSTSSGFGGSNTMAAMTSSFNSVNVSLLADQKPLLSRSLESLAVIAGPSTSDSLFMMNGQIDGMLAGVDGMQHKDDSRINYSFDYDSGMGHGSGANSTATTANESFSSVGDSSFFSSSTTQQQLIDELDQQQRLSMDDQQQHFDTVYNDIIDGMQQCRPFQQQLATPQSSAANNDFEMDEC